MDAYGYISAIALFFYTFMMLIFLFSKRSRIINGFLVTLAALFLWTSGSLLMRDVFWPSYKLWYHVSLLGILLLPYAYFRLINAFADITSPLFEIVYPVTLIVLWLINIPTGVFLACPELTKGTNDYIFTYKMTWGVAVLFLVTGSVLIHALRNIIFRCRNNRKTLYQVKPVLIGMGIVFGGNLLLLVPIFQTFPIDILSGLVNAVILFWVLIKRRVFKVTLLAKPTTCYGVGVLLCIVLFGFVSPALERFLNYSMPQLSDLHVTICAVIFLICVLALSRCWSSIINNVFIKEESRQTDLLSDFNIDVSKSLSLKDILRKTVDIIIEGCHIETVYICIRQSEKDGYKAECSNHPLKDLSFSLKPDHPLIRCLDDEVQGISTEDFKHTLEYKAMWESEKRQLSDLHIAQCIPIRSDDGLTGVILLSGKEKDQKITSGDLSFLHSVSAVSSIALKNAQLYERIAMEARTDDLTGLYKRKYFRELLESEFEKNPDASLSLVLLNIDDFKLYNQLYGAAKADDALRDISRILTASVGQSGSVARYSGKEFAILLPGYDIYSAQALTENICRQIREMNMNRSDLRLKQLTVSAGISAAPYAASNVKELMENADLAVYKVKHSGKNNIHIYNISDTLSETSRNGSKVVINEESESTIFALMAAIDAKDHYTFDHSNNVAYYATQLAKILKMDPVLIDILRQAALMHDIGKIGISEQILTKPNKLTYEEYEIMKGHVEASIEIIRHLSSLDYVIPAVIGHHERYDGTGYPRRIAGRNIPLTARILGLADAFDAMICRRCYKDPLTLTDTIAILEKESGKQFDPHLVSVFVDGLRKGTIKVLYKG